MGLPEKLRQARQAKGLSTRRVAEILVKRFPISHATVANYETGRTKPPLPVLSVLADLYERPLNWFLKNGRTLMAVRYRNLPSRVRIAERHRFEAEVHRWLEAYLDIEGRMDRPLKSDLEDFRAEKKEAPDDFARRLRVKLDVREHEPIQSVIEVLERFGIRVMEQSTELRIDGLAARFGDEYVVVLNPNASNDRSRLNAAHELGHVLYGDCDKQDGQEPKELEVRAFTFASHFLMPNSQLKRAFEGQSMVRLVQFKERFGVSLAAMLYRAEHVGFVPKRMAKRLWVEFSRRGWRTNEPGYVRPDRATRFEQLLDQALFQGKLTLQETANLFEVRADELRMRLDMALCVGFSDSDGPMSVKFPGQP